MRLHGIGARHKRRFKVTTDSAHTQPIAKNLLARQFKPSAPNRVWTSDITFIATEEGWLYLAVVIDLFNRQSIARPNLFPVKSAVLFFLQVAFKALHA